MTKDGSHTSIVSLRLQNYRSYTDDSFEFDNGVNIIVGPNASGKTNLLESVLMLCVGKSYRAKDSELLAHEASWARLDAETELGRRTVKLQSAGLQPVSKTYEIDGNSLRRLSLQKSLPVILFEPNNLLLLVGSPEGRREYLDNLIEQLVPGFSTVRRQYKRALSQRNALLKLEGLQNDQLFAWNIRLSQLGAKIATERMALVQQFQEQLATTYGQLSRSHESVEIRYQSACLLDQYGSDLLYKLDQSTQQDMIRGFTNYGPHREDFGILLKGHPSAEVASRGETRSILLSLKLIELQLIEQHRQQSPILLLDDVFSELDGARRRALTEVLASHQAFITTTDADIVLKHFPAATSIIPLEK